MAFLPIFIACIAREFISLQGGNIALFNPPATSEGTMQSSMNVVIAMCCAMVKLGAGCLLKNHGLCRAMQD